MVAGALAGLSAQAADAQLIGFGTQGTFSGTGCSSFDNDFTMSTCTVGTGASAVTLTYTRVMEETSGGNVSFGQFRTVGGGLEWSPVTPRAFMIGDVSYEVLVDNDGTNGIAISSPFSTGLPSNAQTIRGSVSVDVPEPSSALLLMAGMAAFGMIARRRGSAA